MMTQQATHCTINLKDLLSHLVVVREVVSVLHALVAADDVEQVVVGQKPGCHVGAKQAGITSGVGEATELVLKKKNTYCYD
jgi:hypothetical protein